MASPREISPPAAASAESEASGAPAAKAKAPTVLSQRDRTVVEEYRERISKIYREKQPSKIDEIEKFFQKYKGQEHGLYQKICRKYGVEEEPEYRGASPFGGGLSVLGMPGLPDKPAGLLGTVFGKTGLQDKPVGLLGTLGTPASSNKSEEASGPADVRPASAATSPVAAPTQLASFSEGTLFMKPLLSGAPSASPLQGSVSQVSAPSGASTPTPSIPDCKPEAKPALSAQANEGAARDGAPTRSRSRSPRQTHQTQAAAPVTTVWAVTYRSDIGGRPGSGDGKEDSHSAKTVAVCSSKLLAKAAAVRIMQTRKAEMDSNSKCAAICADREDLACGFTVIGKGPDGTERHAGFCEWLLSSHILE